MDFGIKDKIAVITGSDSGIGKATAKLLAAEGVKVALLDKTTDELKATADEIAKIYFTRIDYSTICCLCAFNNNTLSLNRYRY